MKAQGLGRRNAGKQLRIAFLANGLRHGGGDSGGNGVTARARYISLGLSLLVFWLVLSGHYTAFLISLGILASLLGVYVAQRMGVVDYEGHPVELGLRAFSYFAWLAWQIIQSALHVTRIILTPRMPISPTLLKVTASQKDELGVNIYGNSITLTPGTITIDVKGRDLTVHALTREAADDLATGAMDARVNRFVEGQ